MKPCEYTDYTYEYIDTADKLYQIHFGYMGFGKTSPYTFVRIFRGEEELTFYGLIISDNKVSVRFDHEFYPEISVEALQYIDSILERLYKLRAFS
jgi:hypothetical protein